MLIDVGPSSTRCVFAPAKVNLYLHVTGRRDNGYHLLDSLVAFADIGDALTLTPASAFAFSVDGPFARGFTANERDSTPGSANLVVRAAWAISRAVGMPLDVQITLTKDLPLASGVGGGSTDAAAVLRALLSWWALPPRAVPMLDELMNRLGADVPMCFSGEPQWVNGIGDVLEPLSGLPEAGIVLVNPGRHCPTGKVFAGFEGKFLPQGGERPAFPDFNALIAFLDRHENVLTAPASHLVPEINAARDVLSAQPGCRLARMSGSGATCFGLFSGQEDATSAANTIAAQRPEWWVRSGALNRRQTVLPTVGNSAAVSLSN